LCRADEVSLRIEMADHDELRSPKGCFNQIRARLLSHSSNEWRFKMPSFLAKRKAFTLVELLVAVGIIAVLISLLAPAVQRSREAANRLSCRNKLYQISLAMQNYHSTFNVFPPGGVHTTTAEPGTIPTGDELTDGRAPWTVLILPALDEANRYNSFNFDATFACRADLTSMTPEPNLTQQFLPNDKYTCPSNISGQNGLCSNYAACQGGGTPSDAAAQSVEISWPRLFFNNGIFFHNSSISMKDLADGSSNTVALGETKYIGTEASFQPTNAWWPWSASIRADDAQWHASLFNISAMCDPINFPQNGQYTEQDIRTHRAVYEGCGHGGQQRVYGSWHTGGAHFAMADGSVHFLSENMDLNTYRALGKRASGTSKEF
jgi:prepilin-type N-terminal cleavage/methylation domain-containing protein/prepilin-type processing-associated H-X9-DG protein